MAGWAAAQAPWPGLIALDGNLTVALLSDNRRLAAVCRRRLAGRPGQPRQGRTAVAAARPSARDALRQSRRGGLLVPGPVSTPPPRRADGLAGARCGAGAGDRWRARLRRRRAGRGRDHRHPARGAGDADHRGGRHVHGRSYRGRTSRRRPRSSACRRPAGRRRSMFQENIGS